MMKDFRIFNGSEEVKEAALKESEVLVAIIDYDKVVELSECLYVGKDFKTFKEAAIEAYEKSTEYNEKHNPRTAAGKSEIIIGISDTSEIDTDSEDYHFYDLMECMYTEFEIKDVLKEKMDKIENKFDRVIFKYTDNYKQNILKEIKRIYGKDDIEIGIEETSFAIYVNIYDNEFDFRTELEIYEDYEEDIDDQVFKIDSITFFK